MIIDMLYNDSPSSANELARASSFYYHMTRYRQYRELCVTISATTNEVAFQNRLAVMEEEGLFPAIRRLKVRIRATDKQKCTTSMIEFLGKMMTLRDLEWRYATKIKMATCVPHQLISLLQSRPQVRLHAGVSPSSVRHPRSEHDFEYNLYRLEELKNLRSFQIRFAYRKPKTCELILPCVKRVMMSCPNLRKLKIDIQQRWRDNDRLAHYYAGLGFVDGERLPALEELHLGHYEFGHDADEWPLLGRCIGYPGNGDEMAYWAETFDWSMLRRVHMGRVQFAVKIAPKLISLQEVSVDNVAQGWRVFFQSLPVALRIIKVPSFDIIDLETLTKHGRCLKKLDLAHSYYKSSRALDASSLLTIREECPRIRDLALDLDRAGEWPYEMLDILTGFPQLQNLTIRLDSGTPERMIQPYVTYSAVCHLFSYFRSQRSLAMKPLRQLTINTGSFHYHQWDRSLRKWTRDLAITFSCRMSGAGDDDNGNGSLNVRCQHLSEEENQQLARSTSDSNLSIDSNKKLRVVQQGPTACEWQ
ncbi:unnamed protein product [Clonostachys solani]|uniref:Uncharacterized protein n=1 Tax=Clonostachys solani TaxID=160281 RepID=A0A9N9W3R4_9HYPO|nr:unnamed protein product [Clonostachys solani]